jgi:hypothetical protein
MGFFDWLFGRKNKAPKGTTAPAAAPEAEPIVDEEEDDDFSEATTFISRRLPPSAQREIKNLRTLLAKGVKNYVWVVENNHCGPCDNGCNKFVVEGPYAVGAGLSGQAPVPGRESPNGDCQCTVQAADD